MVLHKTKWTSDGGERTISGDDLAGELVGIGRYSDPAFAARELLARAVGEKIATLSPAPSEPSAWTVSWTRTE